MGKRRTFTDEQKRIVLREVEENGLAVTLRKHSLYAKTIYQWRERFSSAVPQENRRRTTEQQTIRRLEAEVQQLKELVAEKEMTIRIKDSLLKKTSLRGRID